MSTETTDTDRLLRIEDRLIRIERMLNTAEAHVTKALASPQARKWLAMLGIRP